MDLRIVKTKKGIREAFLKLRAKIPLVKVKVKDICDIAQINKTTFYKHYQDVFALSEEIENEAISLVVNSFETKDLLFQDPKKFIEGLPKALDSQKDTISVLFKFNDGIDILFEKLEKQLKEYYINSKVSQQEDILLTFAIGGTFHALKTLKYEGKYNDEVLAIEVSNIISKLNIEEKNL